MKERVLPQHVRLSADRQTDRKIDRLTDGQTYRETYIQRDRQTDRQTRQTIAEPVLLQLNKSKNNFKLPARALYSRRGPPFLKRCKDAEQLS